MLHWFEGAAISSDIFNVSNPHIHVSSWEPDFNCVGAALGRCMHCECALLKLCVLVSSVSNWLWVPAVQDTLERTRLEVGAIYAFVELHIEQGPVLEVAGEDIGVVTAIAAPATLKVRNQQCSHSASGHNCLLASNYLVHHHDAELPPPRDSDAYPPCMDNTLCIC